MSSYRINNKLVYVFILAINLLFICSGCYAEFRGGFNHPGGWNYHQDNSGYYQGGDNYYHPDNSAIIVGAPIEGYYGSSTPYTCPIVQQCYPNGNCVQSQVCN